MCTRFEIHFNDLNIPIDIQTLCEVSPILQFYLYCIFFNKMELCFFIGSLGNSYKGKKMG